MSERKHITSETHPSHPTSHVPGVPTGTAPSTLPPGQKESHTDVYLSGAQPNLAERPLHEGGLPTTAPVVETETRYHRPIPGRTQHKEEVIEKRQVFVEKIEKEPHRTRIVQTEERPIGGYPATGTTHAGVLHDIPIQTAQTGLERQPGEHPLLVTEPQQTKIYTQEQPERIRVFAPVSESTLPTEHIHETGITGRTVPTEPLIPERHARVIERPVETGTTVMREVPTYTSTTGEPIVHVHKYEKVDPTSQKLYEHTHISEHYTPEQAARLKSDIKTYEKEYLPTETSSQLTKCPRCNLENCICATEKEGKYAKGKGASKPKHSDVYHERAFGEKPDPHKLIIKEGQEGEILVEGKKPGISKPNLPQIHEHERPLHHDVVISSKYPTNQTEGLDLMKNKMHEKTSEAAMGKKDKPIVPEPRTENYNQKERVAMAQKGAEHMKDVNKPYEEIAVNPRELYGPPQKEDPFSSAVENERAPKIQKKAGNLMGSISQGAEELSKKVFGDEKASAGRGEKYSDLIGENIPPTQQVKSEKKVPSSSAVPVVAPIDIAMTDIPSTTQPQNLGLGGTTFSNVPMTYEPVRDYTGPHPPQRLTEPTEFVELGLGGDTRIQMLKRADFKYTVPIGDTQELIRQEIRSTPFEVFEGIGCSTEPDEIEEQPSTLQSIKQGYEQMGNQFIEMGKGFSSEISRGMQEGKRDMKSLGQQIREVFTRDTSRHPVYKTYRFPEGFIELTPDQVREKMLPPEGVPLSELSTNKPYQAKGMQPPNIPPMADIPQPQQKESTSVGQKVKSFGKSIKQGLENIAEGMKNIGLETQEGIESSTVAPSTGPVESAHGAETFETKARKPAYSGKEDSTWENIKSKADGYQRYFGHKFNEAYYRGEQRVQDYRGESDFTQAATGVKAVSEGAQAEGLRLAGQGLDKYEQMKQNVSDGMESLKNTVSGKENEKSQSGGGILTNLRNLNKKEKADSGKVEKYSTEADESMERAKQKSQQVKSDIKDTYENLKGITSDVKEDVSARAKEGHAFTQEYIDQLKRQASSKGDSAMHTVSSLKDRANDTKDEAQATAQEMGKKAMQKGTGMKESAQEVMSSGIQKAKDITEPITTSANKTSELGQKATHQVKSGAESVACKTSELGQQALSSAADKSETVKQGTEYVTEKRHEAKGAYKLLEAGADMGKEATKIGMEAAKVAAPMAAPAASTGTSILGYASRAVESAISFKNKLMGNYTPEQQQELIETMETNKRIAEVSHTQIESAKEKSDMISEVIQLGRSEINESVAEKGLEFKHPELSYNKSLIDQAKEVIDDVKEYFEVEAAIMLEGPESLKNLHFKSEAERAKSGKASGFSTFSNLTYKKSTEKAQAGRESEMLKGTEESVRRNVNEGSKSLIEQAKDVIQGVKEYFEVEASLITGGPESLKNKSFKSESERAKTGYQSGSASLRNSLKDRYKEKADAGKSETSKKLGSTFDKPKQKTEHSHEYLKKKEPEIKEGVHQATDSTVKSTEHALQKTDQKLGDMKASAQDTAHHAQKSTSQSLEQAKHKTKETGHMAKAKTGQTMDQSKHTAHKGLAKAHKAGEEMKHDTKKRGVQAKQTSKGVVQKAKETTSNLIGQASESRQSLTEKVVGKSQDTGQKMQHEGSVASQKTQESAESMQKKTEKGAEEMKHDTKSKAGQFTGKASDTLSSAKKKTMENTEAAKDKVATKSSEKSKHTKEAAHDAKKVMKGKGHDVKKSSEHTGHSVKKDMKDPGSDIKQGASETGQSVAQGSKDLLNQLKSSSSEKASAGRGENIPQFENKENVQETQPQPQESKGLVQTVAETASSYVSKAAETIGSVISSVTGEESKEALKEKNIEMGEMVQGKAKEGTQAVKESSQSTVESVKKGVQETGKEIKEGTESAAEKVKESGKSTVKEGLKQTSPQVKEEPKKVVSPAPGVQHTGPQVKEGVKPPLTGVKEGTFTGAQVISEDSQGVKLDQPKGQAEDIKRGPHLPEELTVHEVGKTTIPKSTTTKGSWTLPGPPATKSPLKQSQKHKPLTKEDFMGTEIHVLEADPDKGEKILQHISKRSSKTGSNKPMKPMKKLKNRNKSKEKEKASSGKPDFSIAEGSDSLPNRRVIQDKEQGYGKHSIKHESPSKEKTQKHKPPTKEDFEGTEIHVLESDPNKGEKILQHISKRSSKTGSNKPMKPMKKLKNPHHTKESEKAHSGRGENISDKLTQENLENLPPQIKETGKEYQQAAMRKGTELKELTQERSQQASQAAMEKGAQLKESTKESSTQATEYEKSWGDTILETAQEIGHVALEELHVIADTAATVVRKASDSLIEVKDKILGSSEETSEQASEKAQEAAETVAKKGTELKENVQAKTGQASEEVAGKATKMKEEMESSEERSRELAEKGTELTKEAVEHGAIDMSDKAEESSHSMENKMRARMNEEGYAGDIDTRIRVHQYEQGYGGRASKLNRALDYDESYSDDILNRLRIFQSEQGFGERVSSNDKKEARYAEGYSGDIQNILRSLQSEQGFGGNDREYEDCFGDLESMLRSFESEQGYGKMDRRGEYEEGYSGDIENRLIIFQSEQGYGERVKDIEERVDRVKQFIHKERDQPLTGKFMRENETAEDPRMGHKRGTQVPEETINPTQRDFSRGFISPDEWTEIKNREADRNRQNVEQEMLLHHGDIKSTTEKTEEKIGQVCQKLHENVEGMKESMASGLKSMLNLGMKDEKAESGRDKFSMCNEKSSMNPPVSLQKINEEATLQTKGTKGDLSKGPTGIQMSNMNSHKQADDEHTDETVHTSFSASKS